MKWMSSIKSWATLALVATLGLILAQLVFAQDAAPADLPVGDFLAQVIAAVKAFGGLSWMAKVGSVCIIIISSMKVSFLNDLIWKKLGALQPWLAPILALIGGVLAQGSSLTWAGVFAYLGAGAGAAYFHDILDLIKKIPGIGSMWVTIIDLIAQLTGGPVSGAPAVK